MTSKEFAKLIGVSQSMISRAMNDSTLVSEKKRQLIQQKALEYGFVLNSQAQSLKTNKTGTVGVLFPRHYVGMHANLGLAYLYDLVHKELHQHGYDVMVIYDFEGIGGLSVFERIIKQHKVDGFIVMRLDFSQEETEIIKRHNIPCVYLLNAAQIGEESSSCISDSEYGGYLVGQYLGKFKEYRPCYIGTKETADSESRLNGYIHGLKEQESILESSDQFHCRLSTDSVHQCVIANQAYFMSRKISVFAYNDMMAMGVLSAVRELGLSIPEDIQVVGMDGLPLIKVFSPNLTTVHLFQERIAKKGCNLLHNVIEGKQTSILRIIVKPELERGNTTL